MARGPQIEADIQGKIVEVIQEHMDWPAYRVHRELQRCFPGRQVPSLRWVQMQVRKWNPPKPETWRMADATPEEAATVLDVLSAAIALSGTRAISSEQAKWIMKIKTAVPQMPPVVVWRFSLEYVAAGDKDTGHLDASLAVARRVVEVAPGEFHLDGAEIRRHVVLHVNAWIDRPLVIWAGSRTGGAAYVEEVGNHASLVKRDGMGYFRPDYSWYDNDGFGRLLFQLAKGALS